MKLGSFPELLATLQPSRQRKVALSLVASLQSSGVQVQQAQHVTMLLTFLRPVVLAGAQDADIVRFFTC